MTRASSAGPQVPNGWIVFADANGDVDILLIEVEDWGGGPPGEPRRTGRAACIAEAGLRRCVRSAELVEHTLRKRYAFVSQAAWKSFGLAGVGEGEGDVN